ncbi:hypothetical protein [Micromonospora sp. WMMD812]|uniref:hypothetical protein n=1 Tax=Micromonospora sp. WMMD812 TaxID=3015152 RepID=UPI00248BF8E4|nr:hypothetical protein [Micromonospora sp. WMMD812]WBB68598.1 hypothetical protein O7603_04245 [Micromonospora sp. WMMD812]
MDDREREQALLTALTTEHFVLQTSRSATVTESVGRATVFLSLLSATLIGLGFVASNDALVAPYLAAVLPTLLVTGAFTFLRLVQNMVENEVDLERIQRIRAYYHHRLAGGADFFADALQGEGAGGPTWAAVGNRPRRAQLLLTTAAMVGAVNALLAGLGVTLLVGLAGLSPGFAIGIGAVVAVLAFVAEFAYVNRRSISIP